MATQVVDFAVPAGFVRRDEAMKALGVSDATIERLARDEQRLASKLVPVQGRKPERVYRGEDVERLKAERERRRAMQSPSAQRLIAAGGENGGALLSVKTGHAFNLENLRELAGAWAEQRETIGVREKFWLTWDEAAALSGIPVASVRQAAADQDIVAKKFGRSWRVLRKSLEAFEG